jgi:hypothetical protein
MSNMGPIQQGPTSSPQGSGDQGQTWDPTGGPDGKGAWIPRPASGNMPTDQFGNPAYSGSEAPTQGGQVQNYGDPQVGRVRGGDAAGGTNVVGPDGKVHFDESLNGRQADVDRLRALGDDADKQKAYELNYANANADAALGQGDRARQQDAAGMARWTALGHDSVAQGMGHQLLKQGADMSRAGALSTRGGPLAGVAALHNQQNTESAYTQKGNLNLAAAKADEMEAARKQYGDMADATRAGDVAAQGANQKQAINQGKMENDQRDLNQTTQMGYEQMGQGVNEAAQRAALGAAEQAQGIDSAASARNSRNAQDQTNAVMGVVDNAGSAYSDYSKQEAAKDPNKPTSDRRAKSMASLYGGKR